MDEELNTTTTPAANAAPAAAGNAQTTPEATAPTAEQQSAFQKFMTGLFGAKGQEGTPAPATGEGAPAAEAEKDAGSKAFTEADLQAKLEAAKQSWAAERQEQERLSKLPPDERTKAEAEAKDKRLTELETKLLQRDLKDTALTRLQKDGFPVGLAELLNYTDQAAMEKSLEHAQEVFKGCLEAAVKERLKGKTPEGLGGAANAENSLNDQIAKNIRGGLM